MRAHGGITSPAGFGLSDHVCWAYGSEEERLEVVFEWLDDGWWLGQRMVYTAGKPLDELIADLEPFGDVEALIAGGELVVAPTEALYDLSKPIDTDAQLAFYAAAVEQANADGFNGVRVAADITPLVTDPARRASHARWEHVADRWMAAGNRLAPMCSYDRRVVSGADIDDICAVHPLVNDDAGRVPFHVFAAGDTIALDGEVDAFGAPQLERILENAVAPDPVMVDLNHVHFVDHHAILALARHARDTGAALAGVPAYMRKLWSVLEVERRFGVACP